MKQFCRFGNSCKIFITLKYSCLAWVVLKWDVLLFVLWLFVVGIIAWRKSFKEKWSEEAEITKTCTTKVWENYLPVRRKTHNTYYVHFRWCIICFLVVFLRVFLIWLFFELFQSCISFIIFKIIRTLVF